ncbi:hypothetical protein B0J13DRAFT_531145 [Dactylonectria estremocensis]|uniref:Uncharacterized protein n=1 Tax=Dactylonectria estremocensis TaxID=1079267 RepID=A0A9P9DS22_9HYPO|nr:hypothetical protein B0J13DRAFT_531145 [Dactylonectria estremocensis]
MECWQERLLDLQSGARSQFGPVPVEFFEGILIISANHFDWPEILGNPDYDDGNLFSCLMDCLGSQTNDINFAVTIKDLNWVKGKLIQLHDPIMKPRWDKEVQDNINYVLGILQAGVATFSYMNSEGSPNPNVFNKLLNIINDILLQLVHAENLFKRKHRDIWVIIGQFFLE